MEQLEYNLLFRWFVGNSIDGPVWVPTVFTKNRDRLMTTDIARKLMAAILAHEKVAPLLSDDHSSVDGTLVEAWASFKGFQPTAEPSPAPPDDPSGDPPTPPPSSKSATDKGTTEAKDGADKMTKAAPATTLATQIGRRSRHPWRQATGGRFRVLVRWHLVPTWDVLNRPLTGVSLGCRRGLAFRNRDSLVERAP